MATLRGGPIGARSAAAGTWRRDDRGWGRSMAAT